MTFPTDEQVEKAAREIFDELFGGDADELIHHPAAKSWEAPTEPRWTQCAEAGRRALLTLSPSPELLSLMEAAVEAVNCERYVREARTSYEAGMRHEEQVRVDTKFYEAARAYAATLSELEKKP